MKKWLRFAATALALSCCVAGCVACDGDGGNTAELPGYEAIMDPYMANGVDVLGTVSIVDGSTVTYEFDYMGTVPENTVAQWRLAQWGTKFAYADYGRQEKDGDNYILTDDHSATTVPDIYAAGDCTVSHDITADTDRILAILPNAYMQGETAGRNMAGGSTSFDKAIPMNASGFMGLHMITAGAYDGETYLEQDEEHYKLLVTRDNHLVGFIMIGDVDRAGIYTSLIRERTPLDTIDFDLIREKPQLMAFSRAERAKKLGGAH